MCRSANENTAVQTVVTGASGKAYIGLTDSATEVLNAHPLLRDGWPRHTKTDVFSEKFPKPLTPNPHFRKIMLLELELFQKFIVIYEVGLKQFRSLSSSNHVQWGVQKGPLGAKHGSLADVPK